MQQVFMYSFVIAISILLIAISALAIYGVSIVLRDAGLGILFERPRAFSVARRLKLRYKGSSAWRVRRDDESRFVFYAHSIYGCGATLFRGIAEVPSLTCKGVEIEIGDSVFYCPKCEVVVELISEAGSLEPEDNIKKGPLGIVR